MKKTANVILLFTLILSFCISTMGCGCYADELHVEMDAGTYLLEAKSYKHFLEVEADYRLTKFDEATTDGEIDFKITPQYYAYKGRKDNFFSTVTTMAEYYFEDCYLELEIKINDTVDRTKVALDSSGCFEGRIITQVPRTYEMKKSFKVVGAGGYVVAPLVGGSKFEYRGIEYTVYELRNENGYICQPNLNKMKGKVLRFPEIAISEEGSSFRVSPSRIFSNGTETVYANINPFVECVVFEGEFDSAFHGGACLEYKVFPNLKVVAFESIANAFETIYESDSFFEKFRPSFPESGVTIYVGNYDDEIRQKFMSKVNFVNDVKPYSELPEEYR